MTLVPAHTANLPLVVPDHNFPDRLCAFAEQLQARRQISEEEQQHMAFQLSQNAEQLKAFDGKIADTQASIIAIQKLLDAMRSVNAMQKSIQNNSSRVERIRKEVHFSLCGGSARLQLHTCQNGETFEVTVPKRRGQLFGIKRNNSVVLDILDGGCIHQFNESQPQKPVLVGDTILEINHMKLQHDGSDDLFIEAHRRTSTHLKIMRQPSDFCVVDGVCLNKIIESNMLWVAPEGVKYDPCEVTVCKNVKISLDAADAAHPSRLGFVNRGFYNSARYTLCDGISLRLCDFLDKTHVLKLTSNDPYESRSEHKQYFLEVWYEKNLGISRERKPATVNNANKDRSERSRSPARSMISEGSCLTGNTESSAASITCDPKDKCFLRDTLLKSHSGALVRVDELEMGARILGASGNMLQVMQVLRRASAPVELVEVRTHDARLKVTACHRVMVVRGGKQAAPASSLRHGDHVVDGNGDIQSLTSVIRTTEEAELFQITFHPDEAVEAFMIPKHSILSFGHAKHKTRRSGMGQRAVRMGRDAVSIPNTDDSLNL